MSSAYSLLLGNVLARRETPALIRADGSVITWRALDDASAAYASALQARGIARGDRVALFAESAVDVVVAAVGHHRAGFVHVPANPGYGAAERAHVVDDSGAKLVLDDASLSAL